MARAAGTYPAARLFPALIYGLILASTAAQFAIVPIMPTYADRLGLSGSEQGLVLGAVGLATLAVSLPAGALSDRLGARRVTLWSGLLMAIATVAQAFAGSFPVLFASRLAFGIGYGTVWTAGLCWLVGAAADGSALSGTVAAGGVGGVAGPAASGALVQHLGLGMASLATAAGFGLLTAGLAALRMPASPAAPRARAAASLRAAAGDPGTICATVAIVTTGLSTGVSSLLAPAELHASGASPGRIGLYFAISGLLFAAGSTLTASAGRRAVNLAVLCGGMFVLVAALGPAVLSMAPLPIIAMLCVTTPARAVLWTVSYPLAANAADRRGTGIGAVVGLLNGVWAATAVLGPLAAGVAAEHLSARAVFGVTQAVCAAALAAAVVMAWRARGARTPPSVGTARPVRRIRAGLPPQR